MRLSTLSYRLASTVTALALIFQPISLTLRPESILASGKQSAVAAATGNPPLTGTHESTSTLEATGTETASPEPSPTATETPLASGTPAATTTPEPSTTPVVSPTLTATSTETVTPTETATPTETPTEPAPTEDGPKLLFIENMGQVPMPLDLEPNSQAKFYVQGPQGTIYFAPNAIWVTVLETPTPTPTPTDPTSITDTLPLSDPSATPSPTPAAPIGYVSLKISFPGGDLNAKIDGELPSETKISYFIGNEPENWHPDVPVWEAVRYTNVYSGVDLVAGSAYGQLTFKWEFHDIGISPTVQAAAVRLKVEGMESLGLSAAEREILINTQVGLSSFPLPEASGAQWADLLAA